MDNFASVEELKAVLLDSVEGAFLELRMLARSKLKACCNATPGGCESCSTTVTASSYANNNNQLAVMPGDRIAQLEWSRRYLSVLGVENNRLYQYQLRLQVPEKVADLEQQDLQQIMESFKVLTIEA